MYLTQWQIIIGLYCNCIQYGTHLLIYVKTACYRITLQKSHLYLSLALIYRTHLLIFHLYLSLAEIYQRTIQRSHMYLSLALICEKRFWDHTCIYLWQRYTRELYRDHAFSNGLNPQKSQYQKLGCLAQFGQWNVAASASQTTISRPFLLNVYQKRSYYGWFTIGQPTNCLS